MFCRFLYSDIWVDWVESIEDAELVDALVLVRAGHCSVPSAICHGMVGA